MERSNTHSGPIKKSSIQKTNLDFHYLQTKTLPEWQHYYNWHCVLENKNYPTDQRVTAAHQILTQLDAH